MESEVSLYRLQRGLPRWTPKISDQEVYYTAPGSNIFLSGTIVKGSPRLFNESLKGTLLAQEVTDPQQVTPLRKYFSLPD